MYKSTILKVLLLLWIILWILAFILIPSRVDFIHGGRFENITELFHKPIIFKPVNAIIDVLISFCAVVLLALIYTSLGSFILRLFSKGFHSNDDASFSSWLALTCTSFILGHAVFSFVFILIGTNGLFKSRYIWSTLLIGALVGFPSLKILYSKLQSTTTLRVSALWKQIKYKAIFIPTMGILFLGLFYTSTRLSYDAVAIYFSDEKLTSLSGQINFFQNNSFIASSFQTGITYAVLISLAGDQAARMYSWINGLVIVLFSLAIGKKLGLTIQARLLVITLILTSTAFVDLTGDGKIDLISTAPAIAAVYWTIVNSKGQNKSTALLVGTLTGISIASRPFNAFLVCLFIGVYYTISFFSSKDRNERFAIFKSVPWLGIGIVIVIIFHLIVNQLVLGDPLSFLHNIQIANSDNWQWTFEKDKLWIIRLLYPFALTILNIPQSNGNISPLFVTFLPLLLSRTARSKLKQMPQLIRVTFAAVITLVLWITVLFTVFEVRYVLFLWVIFYIVLAVVIEEFISGTDRFSGKYAELAIVGILLFANSRMAYITIDTYSPVDKTNTPHCYNHDLCDLLAPINTIAKPNERVLTLSAFRYYLRPDLLACSSRYDEYRELQPLANNNPSQFWAEVYRLGFKYITFEPRYSKVHLGFNITPENDNVPDWLELRPLYTQAAGYASYELFVNNPPISIDRICKNNSSGGWELQDIR